MLQTLPLVFVLAGLTLYTVLAGADFGAGIWQLLAGRGEHGEEIRDHAHHSMGPVWEANHVWLIFVLTVTWTGYPRLFGSVASTLAIPLFIAGLGIILRGAGYALRSGASGAAEVRRIDTALAIASILTPFALGAAAGAIAGERVPVGNAAGHLIGSWANPVAILIGVLAVVFSAYLAAVFLAADAARHHERPLQDAFRARALAAGLVAGAAAVVGLIVVSADAHRLYEGLIHGAGLAALIASGVAGGLTMGLVAARRYEPARYTGALAVAAVVAGWAFARYPVLLPGLTVDQAAAGHDTLVTLVVAVLAGGALLFPALALLFSLTLQGALREPGAEGSHDPGTGAASQVKSPGASLSAVRPGLERIAIALLIAGVGFLNAADASWAHVIGVLALFGFVLCGFAAIVPRAISTDG